MKKIYTLLAALCVCISAMALPTSPAMSGKYKLQLSELGKMIQAQGPDAVLASKVIDQQTRSFTDGSGKVWNLSINLTDQGWWEYLVGTDKDGNQVRFQPYDLPWQIAYVFVSTDDKTQSWDYMLAWPTKFFLDDWGFVEEDEKGNIIVPDDADWDFSPVLLDELMTGYYCEWIDANWPSTFLTPIGKPDTKGYLYNFVGSYNEEGYLEDILGSCMYCPDAFGGSDKATIDGNEVTYYMGNQAQGVFETRALNLDEKYIESVLSCAYTRSEGDTPRTKQIFYKGDFRHSGFYKTFTTIEPTELHIFNGGQVGNRFLRRTMQYQNVPDDIELTRFYLEALAGKAQFAYNLIEEGDFSFNSAQVSWTLGDTEEANKDTEGSDIVFGALYSAPTDEAEPAIPTEKWEMLKFTGYIEVNGYEIIEICPGVQTMLPSGYTFAPLYPINQGIEPRDGMTWCTGTGGGMYSLNWLRDPSFFQIGTTEGAEFQSVRGMDTYYFTYNDKIFYHYDPTDVQKVKEVESVGTNPAGVNTVANDSFNVTVNGNSIEAEGAQVYNLNGQLVNANDVVKGIYVVRSGNKAVKVLVK